MAVSDDKVVVLDDAVAAEKGDVVGHKEEVVAVNDVVVEVDDAVVVPVVERATRGIEISGEWFDDVREVDPDVFFSWVSGGEVANQTSSENGTNETSDSYETDETDPGWRRRRRRWLRGYVSPDSAESDISENERPKSGVPSFYFFSSFIALNFNFYRSVILFVP